MPTKVCLVKAMVFPVILYGCESWTLKKAEHGRIDAFELWCWRRPLRVPWTARRSNQSILKEISPEYSLEGLMLKLKLQYLGTWCKELTHWKRTWFWERLKAGGEGDDRGWDCWIWVREGLKDVSLQVLKIQEATMIQRIQVTSRIWKKKLSSRFLLRAFRRNQPYRHFVLILVKLVSHLWLPELQDSESVLL